jgi:hypothetical protein
MGKKKSKVPKAAAKPQSRRLDNDHDIFLRGLLSVLALVIKKLEYVLPSSIRPYVDLATLKPAAETSVDGKMRYLASDCVYECALQRMALPEPYRSEFDLPSMRFCFLMEGKSSAPSEPIDFQLEDYRKAIWSKDLKNKLFMGIVIPILIYSGKYAWNKRKAYDYFKKYLPIELLDFIPNPNYLVIDLHDITDKEIIESTDLGALRSAFLALKHGHNPDYFENAIPDLFKFVLDDDAVAPTYLLEEFLKLLSAYIQRRSKMTETQIINIALKSTDENMATKVKTMFDIVEERALKQGIALGKAESQAIIKEAEAKVKETEAKAKETEAKAKEMEQKVTALIKILMITTPMTDAQLIHQFQLSEIFVTQLRKEVNNLN